MAIRPLTFIGDRDHPDPLSSVHARRPIVGSGKLPDDLVKLASTRRYYVRAREKPSASIEALGKGDKRDRRSAGDDRRAHGSWGDNPWWMRFVPAYYDGVSLHGAGVESYASDARGYDVHGNLTGYDWAVLRLYDPLGSWLGYFGYNGYSDSWNDQAYWSIIGYPGAIANAERPSFQGSITVTDTDGDSNGGEELESETADITAGDSGGPMFGWWGNDPRLVGVVTGEEEIDFLWWTVEKDHVMSSGSGFTSLAAWGRSNWPL